MSKSFKVLIFSSTFFKKSITFNDHFLSLSLKQEILTKQKKISKRFQYDHKYSYKSRLKRNFPFAPRRKDCEHLKGHTIHTISVKLGFDQAFYFIFPFFFFIGTLKYPHNTAVLQFTSDFFALVGPFAIPRSEIIVNKNAFR